MSTATSALKGRHDERLHGVGHDVLAIETNARLRRLEPGERVHRRRDPGDEVISVAAKWPTAAPRRSRCNPNNDIRLTAASASAGTSSR
jgi:hypothetical protein